MKLLLHAAFEKRLCNDPAVGRYKSMCIAKNIQFYFGLNYLKTKMEDVGQLVVWLLITSPQCRRINTSTAKNFSSVVAVTSPGKLI